jgi:hypothetical protein
VIRGGLGHGRLLLLVEWGRHRGGFGLAERQVRRLGGPRLQRCRELVLRGSTRPFGFGDRLLLRGREGRLGLGGRRDRLQLFDGLDRRLVLQHRLVLGRGGKVGVLRRHGLEVVDRQRPLPRRRLLIGFDLGRLGSPILSGGWHALIGRPLAGRRRLRGWKELLFVGDVDLQGIEVGLDRSRLAGGLLGGARLPRGPGFLRRSVLVLRPTRLVQGREELVEVLEEVLLGTAFAFVAWAGH